MIDNLAQHIDSAFNAYYWPVTLGAAIAFTCGGLVIWLAGLAMGRISASAIGAFFGCIAAYLIKAHPQSMLLLGAVAGAVAGLVVELLVSKILRLGSPAYNLVFSVAASFSGTMAVFLGLILLLMLKDATPLNYITQKKQFYLAVACSMLVFGTLVQLIFCKKAYQPLIKTKKQKKLDEVKPDKKEDWRNR